MSGHVVKCTNVQVLWFSDALLHRPGSGAGARDGGCQAPRPLPLREPVGCADGSDIGLGKLKDP